MKRREFVKKVGLVSATGLVVGCDPTEKTPSPSTGTDAGAAGVADAPPTSAKAPGTDFSGRVFYSDMSVTGADGSTQQGFKHTSSAAQQADPKAPYQMPLTQEEQDIMDGKKGPELAKVMAIVVAHGNAFGAEKLVDLGGAPHCSLYTGTDYMKPMIDLFQQCADAGLKSYAPYTVNPRCYDIYNVNNNETDMRLIYEGYKYQRDLDWVHAQLGAPDLNYRSCV